MSDIQDEAYSEALDEIAKLERENERLETLINSSAYHD